MKTRGGFDEGGTTSKEDESQWGGEALMSHSFSTEDQVRRFRQMQDAKHRR